MALEDITLATLASGRAELPLEDSSDAVMVDKQHVPVDAPPTSPRRLRSLSDAQQGNKENLAPAPAAIRTKRKLLASPGRTESAVIGTQQVEKRARYTTNPPPPSNAYELLCAATRRSSRQQARSVAGTGGGEQKSARTAMAVLDGSVASHLPAIATPLRAPHEGGVVDLLTPSPSKSLCGGTDADANGLSRAPAPAQLFVHRAPLSPGLSSPPGSPVRRSPRLALRDTRLGLASDADADADIDAESDDEAEPTQWAQRARVREQAERDAQAIREARERTMRRFAVGPSWGGGRARMRGPVVLGGRGGAIAGSSVARTASLGLNTAAYLETFASHLSLADYRVTPNVDHPTHAVKDWSPSYTCAYSNAGRRGEGPSFLALGTESGAVKIVNTDVDAVTEAANNASKTYAPHRNAVFDVKWSPDDTRLLTSSADMTSAVYDLATLRPIASLRGHAGSVKTGVWFDQNTVVTGARDGHIFIYDLRVAGEPDSNPSTSRRRRGVADDGGLYPVMSIRNAHNDPTKSKTRATPKSMTCLLALKSQPGMLASTSAADGVVKLWDVRSGIANSRKTYITEAVGQTLDRSTEYGKRPRGANWMVEGNGNIYTLGGDSRIHAHSITQPDLALPISYSHPNLRISTFYVKLAMSPCERYLACGSSHGGVYAWELGQNTRLNVFRGTDGELRTTDTVEGVELGWNGHKREAGAIDWGCEQLVSCSDDYTNRVWRPNRSATDLIRTNPTEAAWHWSGVQTKK